jgi:DNA-directed RNA polymerase
MFLHVPACTPSLPQASKYLADLTMDAIGEMFSTARAIMGWLATCAKVVAAANLPVKWSSPLGLPITQPYHKQAMTVVQTTTQSFTVRGEEDAAVFWRLVGWQ